MAQEISPLPNADSYIPPQQTVFLNSTKDIMPCVTPLQPLYQRFMSGSSASLSLSAYGCSVRRKCRRKTLLAVGHPQESLRARLQALMRLAALKASTSSTGTLVLAFRYTPLGIVEKRHTRRRCESPTIPGSLVQDSWNALPVFVGRIILPQTGGAGSNPDMVLE